MRTDDDVLLDLLAEAISPAVPAEPTLAELMALEEAVRSSLAPQPRRTRLRTKALVALAGMGLLATSGTAFAVEQGGMPRPVRAAAYAVGLPVESPGEHDARVAVARLREGLRKHDDKRVRAAAAVLRSHLDDLPAGDRRAVAEPLLARADVVLERNGEPDPAAPPPAQTTTTVTTGSTVQGGGTSPDRSGAEQDTTTSTAPAGGETTTPSTTQTTAGAGGDGSQPKPTETKPEDPKLKDPKPPKDPKQEATTTSTTSTTSATPTTLDASTPTTTAGTSAGEPGDGDGNGASAGEDHRNHGDRGDRGEDQRDRRGPAVVPGSLLHHE